MQQLKGLIDVFRSNIEIGLEELKDKQNDLVHNKLNDFKDNENFGEAISKAQQLNEQYIEDLYDGLKVANIVFAKKAKDLLDYLDDEA